MKSTHNILIDLRNNLGYPKEDGGVCVLYAEKGIDAFLLGKEEYAIFNNRINFIEKNHETLVKLIQQTRSNIVTRIESAKKINTLPPKISQDEIQLLEVAAFIEQGELYQSPGEYNRVFGKPLSQTHLMEISS